MSIKATLLIKRRVTKNTQTIYLAIGFFNIQL